MNDITVNLARGTLVKKKSCCTNKYLVLSFHPKQTIHLISNLTTKNELKHCMDRNLVIHSLFILGQNSIINKRRVD